MSFKYDATQDLMHTDDVQYNIRDIHTQGGDDTVSSLYINRFVHFIHICVPNDTTDDGIDRFVKNISR